MTVTHDADPRTDAVFAKTCDQSDRGWGCWGSRIALYNIVYYMSGSNSNFIYVLHWWGCSIWMHHDRRVLLRVPGRHTARIHVVAHRHSSMRDWPRRPGVVLGSLHRAELHLLLLEHHLLRRRDPGRCLGPLSLLLGAGAAGDDRGDNEEDNEDRNRNDQSNAGIRRHLETRIMTLVEPKT